MIQRGRGPFAGRYQRRNYRAIRTLLECLNDAVHAVPLRSYLTDFPMLSSLGLRSLEDWAQWSLEAKGGYQDVG